MMNKQGSVLHWIIFGILAAFGLFFILRVDIDVEGVTGKWQADFLGDYYLEAEKDLLLRDQAAKLAGWQIALELGKQGGLTGDCEFFEEYGLWNKKNEWCVYLPDIKKAALDKIEGKLGNDYSEIKLDREYLTGVGKKKTLSAKIPEIPLVKVPYAEYTYDTSFNVDLSYDFDEYDWIITEAQSLVTRCKNKEDLEGCITDNLEKDWYFKECNQETPFNETDKKVLFCVASGSKVIGPTGDLVSVEYKFALDFAPAG